MKRTPAGLRSLYRPVLRRFLHRSLTDMSYSYPPALLLSSPTANAPHPLLRSFQSNTPAFGAWLFLPGSIIARTVAQSSPHLSWVLIDCEHGLTSLQPGAAESIQAIQGIGERAPSAVVRIPAPGPTDSTAWQIKYALDAGARGVLVPMVSCFSFCCRSM